MRSRKMLMEFWKLLKKRMGFLILQLAVEEAPIPVGWLKVW